MSVLSQNHFAFDAHPVLQTVMMGNKTLWTVMHEKDAIYAKPDFNDDDGHRAAELEHQFAEMNGWDAEKKAKLSVNDKARIHFVIESNLFFVLK